MTGVESMDYKRFEQRFEELKALRIDHETFYREADTYVYARTDGEPIDRGDMLPPRNVVDTTAVVARSRLAGVLHGYLFSPFSPFFKARLDKKPNYSERRWLDEMSRAMHRHLTGATSPFRVTMAEVLSAASGYGQGPVWMGARMRKLPSVTTSSVWDVWIDEDPETQKTDTFYRRFRMTAWRAAEKWPDASGVRDLAEKSSGKVLEFVQAIEPNPGGRAGAVRTKKPVREVYWCLETKEAVERGGYDEFPAAVMRWARQPGFVYGESPAREVMRSIKLVNAVEDNNYLAEEMRYNPPLMDFTNGAVDRLDRRPGAQIPVDPSSFMLHNRRPMEPLFEPNTFTPNYQRVQDLRAHIKEAFFVDWLDASMNPADRETAASVHDRRDLRMRAMASVVSRMEHDFNHVAERMYQLLSRAGVLPPPPDSLHDEDLIFEFISPLAMAQQQGEFEKLQAFMQFSGLVAGIDPLAAKVPDAIETMREGARQLGVPEMLINSQEAIARKIREETQGAEAEDEAMLAQSAASTLRDAGQGAAALAKAVPQGGLI